MFDVIPDHRCDLLEVDLIAAPFDILNLIQESFNVFLLEVTNEFSKEDPQLLIRDLLLTVVE